MLIRWIQLATIVAAFSATPVLAQDNATTTHRNDRVTTADNTFDLGWIGLAGLVGLFGLSRDRWSNGSRASNATRTVT